MRLNKIDTDSRNPWKRPAHLLGLALVMSLGLAGSGLAEEATDDTAVTDDTVVVDDTAATDDQAPACGTHLLKILEQPEREGFTRTDLSTGDQVIIHIEGPRGGQVIMGCTAGGERFHGRRAPDEEGNLRPWMIGAQPGVTAEDLPSFDEYEFPGDSEVRPLPPRPPGPPRCRPRPPPFARPGRRVRIPRMRPGQECPDLEEGDLDEGDTGTDDEVADTGDTDEDPVVEDDDDDDDDDDEYVETDEEYDDYGNPMI